MHSDINACTPEIAGALVRKDLRWARAPNTHRDAHACRLISPQINSPYEDRRQYHIQDTIYERCFSAFNCILFPYNHFWSSFWKDDSKLFGETGRLIVRSSPQNIVVTSHCNYDGIGLHKFPPSLRFVSHRDIQTRRVWSISTHNEYEIRNQRNRTFPKQFSFIANIFSPRKRLFYWNMELRAVEFLFSVLFWTLPDLYHASRNWNATKMV